MSASRDGVTGDGETCLDHSHYLLCELYLMRHGPVSTYPIKLADNGPK